MVIVVCSGVRADDIYVSCMTDKSVVKISGNTVSTIATGEGMFLGLSVDASGNLYLANQGDNTILKFKAENGVLSKEPTVFAGGLKAPMDIAFDRHGNLFEIDSTTNNINKFAYAKGELSRKPSVFIDASPEHANLTGNRSPAYLAFDAEGNLYLSIAIGGILKFTHSASGLSNMPDAQPFATVSRARQMAFDQNGNLFTANHLAGDICVYKFPKLASGLSGTPEIFATGNGLDAPAGVAFDSEGNLYIANWGYNVGTTVLKYPNNNGVLSSTPTPLDMKFACPILVWCEKPLSMPLTSKPVPAKHIPKTYPRVPVPQPATPASNPAQFYD